MKYESIEEIRKVLVDELKGYEGEPVLLAIDSKILSMILFDTYKKDNSEYKKFSEELNSVIKKIDFSNVSFDNFYASSVNFTGLKGVKINPQTVARKNLYYSCFCGVTFIGPFDGVSITNSRFAGSKGAVINPQTIRNKDMHGAILSSVIFIGSFDKVIIKYADFTGSKGAVINPEMVEDKSLEGVNLCDTVVIGSFKNVKLYDTCFAGAKSKNSEYIKINPQNVLKKEIIKCILKGVEFIGPFDGVYCGYNIFDGSIGAVINPQTVASKNLKNCNFSNVTFTGSFDGCRIYNSSFEGSNGALIDPQTICDKDLTLVNLKDAIVVDDFEGVETSGMKYDEELLIDRNNLNNEESKKYCIGKIKESVRRNNSNI